MLITEIKGDMFADFTEGALAHGCNCRGAYAAGVAGLVRKKFPIAYDSYKVAVEEGRFLPGSAHMVLVDHAKLVFNLATQVQPGAHADLHLIERSVTMAAYAVETLSNNGEVPEWSYIRMPQIGCGIGGLTWPEVRARIESIDSPVEARVYYL